jgi:transposase
MLTQEEDVEASALRKRGWSIAAIARHLGRDPKTIRAYLSGARRPGERRAAVPDSFAPFEPYVRERLAEDPASRARPVAPDAPARSSAGSWRRSSRRGAGRG